MLDTRWIHVALLIFGAPSSGQFPEAETPVPHSSRHNVCSLGAYVSWYLGEAVYLPLTGGSHCQMLPQR